MKERELCPETWKLCYSREDAGSVLNYTKRNRFGKSIPKRCYYCEACGMWHLTSKPFVGNHRKKKRLKTYR